MDYHSLPRKQLQALCKKHGIPANAANSEMADALTTLLKPKPQPQTHNSKLPEKRATRSREPALSETVSKSNDVEEGLNVKPQKATNTHKVLEQGWNKEPQRITRGRGSASTVTEAPKSAASKTAKTPTASDTETNSATKQQEIKKVRTRNGGSKHSNSEMPPSAEENVDAKTLSPSDKKKEKAGGIVLRRGRVKVRSPRNLSKSPESAQFNEEVAVSTKKNGVGVPYSQSCTVDAKKTRKKKRSVTFSDVIEVDLAPIEHSAGVDVSKNIGEPANETMAEIQRGAKSNLPKNINSASMARKVISTRKASRSVSTDVIAAQDDHQKISKKPSKAKELHTFKAEKTATIEMGGESDKRRAARGKKTVNTVGDAAAKENADVMVVDGFVKGDLIEAVPCARRSRRLTIVPTDVKCNHDMQLATEEMKGQSKDDPVGVSIAPKKTEGDLPAETSRRSRRKTLAPLELIRVQSSVGSVSQQMNQKVSKAEVAQSKSFTSEIKDEALESQQKQAELKTCDSIPVANEAVVQPIKSEEALSARTLRGSRQKALVPSTDQYITSAEEVSNEMGYQKIISCNLKVNVDTTGSEVHSKAALSTSILVNSELDSLQEVSNDEKAKGETTKTFSVMPRSTRKTSSVAAQPDNETPVSQETAFSTQKQEGLEIVDAEAVGKVSNDAKAKDETAKTISVMPRSTRKASNVAAQPDNETRVSQEPALSSLKQEGLEIVDGAVCMNIQYSDDLGVIAQAHHDKSQEILVLKNTNVPRIEDPVISTPSKQAINHRDSFSCEFQVVIGEGGEGQSQISEDADSISCTEEFEHNTCLIDVRNSSMTAIHGVAGDSETANISPPVDIHSIKPDAAGAEKDQEFTDKTSSATSPEHVLSRHKFSTEKDQVIEQENHAMDEPAAIISLTKDMKDTFRSNSPVSRKIQDKDILDGNLHMHSIILENSIENYTDKDSLACSPSATVESATEICVDTATAEREAQQYNGNPVSQEPAFTTQKQEGLEIVDETVDKSIQDSEDHGVIAEAHHEQSQEILILKNTNVPRAEDPVSSTAPTEDVNHHDSFSCAFQVVIGKGDKGQSQISEDADLISSNEDFEHNTCLIEVRSSSMTAIHCEGDSETANTSPLVDTHSIKPDATAAVKDQEFTEETASATLPVHVPSFSHELSIEKDQVIEEESHAIDESEAIISINKGIKDGFRSNSPVSTKVQEKGILEWNHHLRGIESKNSIENNTDNDSLGGATMELATEIAVDIVTAAHEACTFKMHLLSSDKDKIGGMTSGGAADSIEQQPDQVVDLNLCEGQDAVDEVEMDVHDNLRKELQDTHEGVPCDGVKSIVDRSTENEQLRQLSPILPSCSMEPGTAAMPTESACKSKQRHPRAIYSSASKGQFSVPWKNTSLEAYTAPNPNNEANLNSLDQEEKNAEIWGLNNHKMTSDGIDSASSEDEGSSADTEETLSDTEVCNFETEMLIPNTEGDYSCSEDDTPSDSENDTVFDSEELFSEIEGEFLSADESEEQETSEEELSESDDDVEGKFEEFEASPVSQPVAISESIDTLYITGGLEEEQVEIKAASESSLSNDGAVQAEITNPLALENDTNRCAPDVEPTDNDEKVGAQHEESLKHVVTEIQNFEDVVMTHNDKTPIENMQPATDSTCHDSESFDSLSFLFASPPTKVQEDVRCSSAPSGILESDISQESRTLEVEANILPESGQKTSVQFCSPNTLSYKEIVAEVGQQTMDGGAKHEIELCESVGDVEEPEINDRMVELVQNCCAKELQKTSPRLAATKIHENDDVVLSYNDNTVMEQVQSTPSSTNQNSDLLTSLSSLFASPPSRVKEDAVCSLTPVQSESNAESLVSQVVASDTFEDLCGTPKQSNGSEIASVFIHESLNEVAPTMHCAEVASINAQVEEITATYNLVHEITKEQSMKQIDLTLLSVRKLRQMCKGNLIPAKKKTENETKKETENVTPAKTPSRLWMSATKQVHQPNTSIHQRDLPSANKRSALKALSSNMKATPSAAMQTPTAKGSQRPQSLMSAYDGNDGTGKYLVTPSPQAPMTSKRDFARSHHR